jgi:hypothetical protein
MITNHAEKAKIKCTGMLNPRISHSIKAWVKILPPAKNRKKTKRAVRKTLKTGMKKTGMRRTRAQIASDTEARVAVQELKETMNADKIMVEITSANRVVETRVVTTMNVSKVTETRVEIMNANRVTETRVDMVETMRGNKAVMETREDMVETMRGNKAVMETREDMVETMRGNKEVMETREDMVDMVETMRGSREVMETREDMVETMRGNKEVMETREDMVETMRGNKEVMETREDMVETMRGSREVTETREDMVEIMRGNKEVTETKATTAGMVETLNVSKVMATRKDMVDTGEMKGTHVSMAIKGMIETGDMVVKNTVIVVDMAEWEILDPDGVMADTEEVVMRE